MDFLNKLNRNNYKKKEIVENLKKRPVFNQQIYVHAAYTELPQIYTAGHATFPIRIRKITVQICGNFWVTQYIGNF